MYHKKVKVYIYIIILLCSSNKMYSQTQNFFGSGIFNKDTNGVVPAPLTNNGSKLLSDTGWVKTANTFWKLTGNDSINATNNFVGTLDSNILSLRTNKQQALEIGLRNKLGLVQNYTDYTDAGQYLTYLRGTGGTSCLQFQADNANFYKPMFFTNTQGNFRLKGSAAGTDFFELGSAGTANAGSLEFIIGDDGDEPIVFKKYNYTTTSTVEMLRMQGTGLNTNVRVGINMNGAVPNSTFQTIGTISTSIITTAAAITLNETHHTVIVTANVAVTLPAASTCIGREYILKKTVVGTSTITTYVSSTGLGSTNFTNGVLHLQSDGSTWQQL